MIHRPVHKPIFELFDLFSNDVMAKIIDPATAGLLERAGFDISPWLRLALQNFGDSSPKVWLIAPTLLNIR